MKEGEGNPEGHHGWTFRSSRRVLDVAQLTKSARRSAAHWECKRRQLTESAEYREILYQKQCGVEKRRGRKIAEAKLEESNRSFCFLFLLKSCIHLFSAEPNRAKLTRDKELACIGEIWRKQTLCETPCKKPASHEGVHNGKRLSYYHRLLT